MSWWTDARERLRGIFRSARSDVELEEELRFHLEMDIAARMRGGQDEADARHAAARAFGGVDRYREETRDARGVRPLEDFTQDVRYAVRTLARNPGFTAAAVIVLALGIGANTAIFSVVNAVVLQPLPFPDPDRLYMLWEENAEKNWYQQVVAPANMLDWKERVRAFEDVAGYTDYPSEAVLSEQGPPRPINRSRVTGNFFSVLGVRPLHGRAFEPVETWDSGERVAVLAYGIWSTTFNADPGIVNRTIMINGVPVRVVGVMPEGFAYPSASIDVWQPTGWETTNRSQIFFRRAHWMRAIARLSPNATPEQAAAEFRTVVNRMQTEFPETNRVMGAGMTPLHEFLIGKTRRPLLVLLAAVGLLLLIGCANVGNLLLVKAAGRQREIAVRSALGAGRFRLIRQMMTESLVLSALGGAAGVALGIVGTKALARLQPEGLLTQPTFGVDAAVLGYITLVTIVCGLAFGAVPALWTRRAGQAAAVKEGARGTLGRSARALAGSLVVAEVAVALVLVVGAGLLVRSFQHLLDVDPGFDGKGVLAVTVALRDPKYDSPEKYETFFNQLIERARALPGVTSVSATNALPLANIGYTSDFAIAGRGPDEYGSEILHRTVMPGYLRTMRVPLVRGRDFTPADRDGSPPVVMLNERVAREFFPSSDPVGQRIAFDRVPDSTSVWYTVVGVVGSERQRGIASEPQIEVLEPYAQSRDNSLSLVLRATGDPMKLLPGVKRVLAELDPNLPISDARDVEAVRADSLARERFMMVMLLLFSAVAFVLALVGIYGVVAQSTRQRSQEISVRLALGAQPADVLRMIVSRGAILVGSGIGLGLLVALLATRAMSTMLFQVKPLDPTTFLAVAGVLAATGVVASWVPARRASQMDPGSALRPD